MLASVARGPSFLEPLPRAQVKKGREKGRSPVQLELWELRPYERSRCAEHGGSYPKCFGSGVPAPPGIDMVAPQALLHNALMAQF